ncbi:MAG: PIN domain nuclease [Acidobacteria bacterium]|nr:MAG: PIN domain nuclease [Acidobacteriota bacterium]
MKYLLDTAVWLWSVGRVERLSRKGRELLVDSSQEVYFSAASAWEISIKASLGKLRLPDAPETYIPKRLSEQAIQALPIFQHHALKVHSLPWHHQDPFDRLLIAQAQAEGMTILTADREFEKYDVNVVWGGS